LQRFIGVVMIGKRSRISRILGLNWQGVTCQLTISCGAAFTGGYFYGSFDAAHEYLIAVSLGNNCGYDP
jgi:hypothetical protein